MLKLKWLIACFLISFSALAWSQQAPSPAEKPSTLLSTQAKPSAVPLDKAEVLDEPNAKGSVCTIITSKFNFWTLSFVISTYSTYRVEPSCDEQYYDKLTLASINAQAQPVTDSTLTVRGGFHRYTMDVNLTSVSNPYFYVGKLRFAKSGHINITLYEIIKKRAWKIQNLATNTYSPLEVHSKIHYIWNIGTLAHTLIAPNGDRYILYAYTNEVAPDLTRDNLVNLGTRLSMPLGWRYESSLLTRTITVRPSPNSGFDSDILFDEFDNYYVKYIQ